MRVFRYILLLIAMTGVLCVEAQTPRYGTPYRPAPVRARNVSSACMAAQLPSTAFVTTSSLSGSGSTLPQAAVTGVITTYDMSPGGFASGPRRVGENDGFEEGETDPDNPGEPFPIGDTPWLLFLMLGAGYTFWRRKSQQYDEIPT